MNTIIATNLFVLILAAHFIGDWLLQPSWMALQKSSNWKVRFIHCLVYTACFFWLGIDWCAFIFTTHFIIDSYIPLYWFRRLRDGMTMDEFKESFKTPVGFVVNVAMDQIFHFLLFVPIILTYKK